MNILISCPRCGREFEAREPGPGAEAALFQFRCPGGHYVAVRLPAEEASSGAGWGVRVGPGGKRVGLKDGTYTVGRESAERPSDIAVPAGDTLASRRCAELTVSGSRARLRVGPTLNPLRGPGGKPLGEGDVLELSPKERTTVTVGATEVTFDFGE